MIKVSKNGETLIFNNWSEAGKMLFPNTSSKSRAAWDAYFKKQGYEVLESDATGASRSGGVSTSKLEKAFLVLEETSNVEIQKQIAKVLDEKSEYSKTHAVLTADDLDAFNDFGKRIESLQALLTQGIKERVTALVEAHYQG